MRRLVGLRGDWADARAEPAERRLKWRLELDIVMTQVPVCRDRLPIAGYLLRESSMYLARTFGPRLLIDRLVARPLVRIAAAIW